jgi:hypothetical protein
MTAAGVQAFEQGDYAAGKIGVRLGFFCLSLKVPAVEM